MIEDSSPSAKDFSFNWYVLNIVTLLNKLARLYADFFYIIWVLGMKWVSLHFQLVQFYTFILFIVIFLYLIEFRGLGAINSMIYSLN